MGNAKKKEKEARDEKNHLCGSIDELSRDKDGK